LSLDDYEQLCRLIVTYYLSLIIRSELSSDRLVNNQLEMGRAEAVVAGLIRTTE